MSYKSTWDSGNWITICDACGRKFKATQLQKRWDNLMVCADDFEIRQPQDFVRGVVDKIAVPWSRPEGEDQFSVGLYCTINGTCAIPGQGVPGCMVPGYLDPGYNPSIP